MTAVCGFLFKGLHAVCKHFVCFVSFILNMLNVCFKTGVRKWACLVLGVSFKGIYTLQFILQGFFFFFVMCALFNVHPKTEVRKWACRVTAVWELLFEGLHTVCRYALFFLCFNVHLETGIRKRAVGLGFLFFLKNFTLPTNVFVHVLLSFQCAIMLTCLNVHVNSENWSVGVSM